MHAHTLSSVTRMRRWPARYVGDIGAHCRRLPLGRARNSRKP